ncbi:hypothetical protein GLYMA_13G258000v4 [Glycine max]|uniref:Uncharacterized protein n=1 Tax=Glycine max TaxID=3847 RepID=A0A0R0H5Y4_SOYBN|nr:hypothetical protein GLYMA_13G258000v4 [Glycine max]
MLPASSRSNTQLRSATHNKVVSTDYSSPLNRSSLGPRAVG